MNNKTDKTKIQQACEKIKSKLINDSDIVELVDIVEKQATEIQKQLENSVMPQLKKSNSMKRKKMLIYHESPDNAGVSLDCMPYCIEGVNDLTPQVYELKLRLKDVCVEYKKENCNGKEVKALVERIKKHLHFKGKKWKEISDVDFLDILCDAKTTITLSEHYFDTIPYNTEATTPCRYVIRLDVSIVNMKANDTQKSIKEIATYTFKSTNDFKNWKRVFFGSAGILDKAKKVYQKLIVLNNAPADNKDIQVYKTAPGFPILKDIVLYAGKDWKGGNGGNIAHNKLSFNIGDTKMTLPMGDIFNMRACQFILAGLPYTTPDSLLVQIPNTDLSQERSQKKEALMKRHQRDKEILGYMANVKYEWIDNTTGDWKWLTLINSNNAGVYNGHTCFELSTTMHAVIFPNLRNEALPMDERRKPKYITRTHQALLNIQDNALAFIFGVKMNNYYWYAFNDKKGNTTFPNQQGKDNEKYAIIGVDTLIKDTELEAKIKAHNEAKSNNKKTTLNFHKSILQPFENALKCLVEKKYCTWIYCEANGKPLNENHLKFKPQDIFSLNKTTRTKLYIKFAELPEMKELPFDYL